MLYVGYWGVSNGGHERHSLSSLRAEISAARHFRQPMQQRVELLPAFRIVVTKSGAGLARKLTSCLGSFCRCEFFQTPKQKVDQRQGIVRSLICVAHGQVQFTVENPNCNCASSDIMSGVHGGS